MLLEEYAHPIGIRELLAAMKQDDRGLLLKKMLRSPGSIEQYLRGDSGKMTECLKQAVGEAVRQGKQDMLQELLAAPAHWVPVNCDVIAGGAQDTEDVRGMTECLKQVIAEAVRQCREDMLRMLLAAPPHWGPVTPEVLAGGVQEMVRVVRGGRGAGICPIIPLLRNAGADLDMDGGALLAAAERSNNQAVIDQLLMVGVGVSRDSYGDVLRSWMCKGKLETEEQVLKKVPPTVSWGPSLLREAVASRQPCMAASLIRAGIPVGCLHDQTDALLSMWVEHRTEEILTALTALTPAQ
jgi:hypothetical protein